MHLTLFSIHFLIVYLKIYFDGQNFALKKNAVLESVISIIYYFMISPRNNLNGSRLH